MRNDRLIPGTILVIIGAIFLLDNFGYIDFSWGTFISLWPIILIIAGVNLVFAHNRTGWATALKILVLIIGMGILVWGGITHRTSRYNFSFDDNNNSDDSTGYSGSGKGNYNEPFDGKVQTARLNISGGATSYTLTDTTNQLFDAKTQEFGAGYTLKTSMDDSTEVIDFDMNSKHHHSGFIWGRHNGNHADIKLNSKPVWDIDVSTGASNLKFDLSAFKVKKLNIEGGAASFDIKMGKPLEEDTKVDIQTGVSSVTVSIPKNAACRITTDTGLSSKSFDGFNRKSDSEYQTPGFDNAPNKMYINMSGGVSDFKVNHY